MDPFAKYRRLLFINIRLITTRVDQPFSLVTVNKLES